MFLRLGFIGINELNKLLHEFLCSLSDNEFTIRTDIKLDFIIKNMIKGPFRLHDLSCMTLSYMILSCMIFLFTQTLQNHV